jgi:hypothetical protein
MSEINLTVEQPPNYEITVTPEAASNISVLLQSPSNVSYTTPGPQGVGVPSGGTTDQALTKQSNVNYDTHWKTIDKTFVGLSNVDNTSDINKPISSATQGALNNKQNTIQTEIFTLSALDITNKFLTLSSTPQSLETVSLFPAGGINQVNGIDFDVVSNVLSWNGLGLDGFLEAGDVLIIKY